MKIIILDGWHKGEMLEMAEAPPVVNLYRPPVVVICDCDPEHSTELPCPCATETYRLAFRSLDGQVALYSRDGRSEVVWRDIGALTMRMHPLGLKTLYINCRDERAAIDVR